jgi:hypothetical protein
MLRPRDGFRAAGGWVLDRFQVSDRPVEGNRHMVTGVLRRAEDEAS